MFKGSKIFTVLFFIALFSTEYLAIATQEIKAIENSWDKLNHFMAFFALYILLINSYFALSVLKTFLVLFVFAVQIEIVQYFIPGREFSFFDIAADVVGMLIGYVVLWMYSFSRTKVTSLKLKL